MKPGPHKAAEALVAILIPPACREEVLGDLYERYSSLGQYILDASCCVPLVIVSRIRRTADPQVVLMQAFAVYLSFVGAAWIANAALLQDEYRLVRLAIPSAAVMLGLFLEDAYAKPGRRSPLKLVRGPVLGLGLALLSQGMFWAGVQRLALPPWIAIYGCAMSLLLSSAIRLLFPPSANQLQGVSAPALWLKRTDLPSATTRRSALVFRAVAAILVATVAGRWITDPFTLENPRSIISVVLVLIAYQLWRLS
jgi:hypothetical protein